MKEWYTSSLEVRQTQENFTPLFHLIYPLRIPLVNSVSIHCAAAEFKLSEK